MNLNPYTPPDTVDAETDRMKEVKQRLSRPATALIIMSSTQSVFASLPVVTSVLFLVQGETQAVNVTQLGLFSLQFVTSVIIAIGAAKMAFLESHFLGRVAGFLACIPFITPFIIVGIPFGIWSLILLSDPTVRVAFRSVAIRDGSPSAELDASSATQSSDDR